jgi:N-acetylglucosamine-6-phosphate deacetylase
MGVSLTDALTMATRTPARFLGIDQERGCIAPGAHADLVAFDAQFKVLGTWIGGQAHA